MDTDTLIHWRGTIKKILSDLAAVPFPEVVNMSAKTVFDEASDVYLVIVEVGKTCVGYTAVWCMWRSREIRFGLSKTAPSTVWQPICSVLGSQETASFWDSSRRKAERTLISRWPRAFK
jgi:hypothetical protein